MKNKSPVYIFFCFCLIKAGIVYATPAEFGPADYVYTPNVEYGEKEIDFKYGSATQKDGTHLDAASLGFGYGATETWFAEFYLKQEQTGSQIANLAEWENKFQLTETGKYPVDVGLITELEIPLSSKASWEFKLGPLLQTEFGRFQLNGNLLFERDFGNTDQNGEPNNTNFSYQWQAKYRWKPIFEYGLQGFGDVGKWDSWNSQADQVHRIGPAVFGNLGLGKRQVIRYNAAWLFGASSAAPNHSFRMQVEYEF